MVYKFFDKKCSGSGQNYEQNYQLSNVYSSFRDNIWGVDLADM